MKLKKTSLLALAAGALFGAVSFVAASASADCADTIPEVMPVKDADGNACSVISIDETSLFIRCNSGDGLVERTFQKDAVAGGES
ncbi:MAG: hypothetical protein VYE40_00515 [Myxococcota bacterium]|jgi:hypothetical protein|nr:hypothetical protein [Myxococcota bacterium]MEC9439560.1 hypothetical protein [Myxococcota bacterium]